MMSCYLSGTMGDGPSPLSAKGMSTLSESQAADYLGLEIIVEKDHPTLPVKIGERDAEAVEIVGLVKKVMNETGAILLQEGDKNLGAFVADTLNSVKTENGQSRANHLIQQVWLPHLSNASFVLTSLTSARRDVPRFSG